MVKEKKTILWISHRPVRFECQHYNQITSFLAQHSYEVKWIEAPQKWDSVDPVAWVSEKIPVKPESIFFGGKELLWFKPIIDTVRSLSGSNISVTPFFWIYEDVEHSLLAQMCQEAFSDFCHISVKPHELLIRLRLRAEEAENRWKYEQALREQSTKVARNETIIKQREEFLGVCAHDLRSPLGLIQSSASMIIKSISEKHSFNPTHLELLNRIKRQATQAVGLVNDLLDVMSFEQGLRPQYQLFNLHELLVEFHKDYSQHAEAKGIHFHYNNPVPDWKILADIDRVRQLLQNVVTNAIKFTDSKKNIYLNVTSFTGRRKNDPLYPMVVISVRDEGKGIPQKEVQKIFDRFSQLKDQSRGEGRGLGLSVAKQISNLHDGNIWVESEEGKGSTFSILLPHVVSRTELLDKKNRTRPVVLVAEPALPRRSEYFDQLEEWGYEVVYARDGVEAVGLLFHLLPNICILTGKLPKLDILDIVSIAKADILTSTIPLVLCGEDSEQLEQHVDTHKFDRFLKLPFTSESFSLLSESVGVLTTEIVDKKAA